MRGLTPRRSIELFPKVGRTGSDMGQDRRLLEILGAFGYAVDVGANDGRFLSNTLLLEEAGWWVLCIEANPIYGPSLWKHRSTSVIGAVGATSGVQNFYVHTGHEGAHGPEGLPYGGDSSLKRAERASFQVPVMVQTLDWYLEVANFPRLDLLCADIEGGEPELLDGFNIERWKPRAVLLENSDRSNPWCYQERLAPYGLVPLVTFEDDELYFRREPWA